ncbi:MAG TPA: methionyl-tRNA formyltransferase [Acidimicrobiia bacterium]|nr:methionyl-tRNA formyltransferase [Acidimicrobiia bacterium]
MSPPPIRAVFLGTPAAAVPTLVSLATAAEVVAVVTRPDQPRGRSARPVPSPVKEAAAKLGVAVLQPANASELTGALEGIVPIDVGVVTAYGTLIRPEALAIPTRGFLNVHFSLLPRWRGANPVVAALLAGDEETGVSLMLLDQGLDTGPVVAGRTLAIGRDETGGELTTRLAALGAQLLVDVLPGWVAGAMSATPQPGMGVTHAPKLTKSDLLLDPSFPAEVLARRIRALGPSPGARLMVGGAVLRVLAGRRIERDLAVGELAALDERVLVGTGQGALELLAVQPPGKRPMDAAAWLRGLHTRPNEVGS